MGGLHQIVARDFLGNGGDAGGNLGCIDWSHLATGALAAEGRACHGSLSGYRAAFSGITANAGSSGLAIGIFTLVVSLLAGRRGNARCSKQSGDVAVMDWQMAKVRPTAGRGWGVFWPNDRACEANTENV